MHGGWKVPVDSAFFFLFLQWIPPQFAHDLVSWPTPLHSPGHRLDSASQVFSLCGSFGGPFMFLQSEPLSPPLPSQRSQMQSHRLIGNSRFRWCSTEHLKKVTKREFSQNYWLICSVSTQSILVNLKRWHIRVWRNPQHNFYRSCFNIDRSQTPVSSSEGNQMCSQLRVEVSVLKMFLHIKNQPSGLLSRGFRSQRILNSYQNDVLVSPAVSTATSSMRMRCGAT